MNESYFKKVLPVLNVIFSSIMNFFHSSPEKEPSEKETPKMTLYNLRQNIFLICEFVVIAACLYVMYQYISIWTITILLILTAIIAILVLVRLFKRLRICCGLCAEEKPQGKEDKPQDNELIYSFHFKNAIIGYWYYVMLLLLSVTFAIVVYCHIVDAQYRKIYKAYLNANVILDTLSQNAAFPESLKNEGQNAYIVSYKRCLIELMRDMKLLSAEDYLIYGEEGKPDESKLGDHPNAVLRILDITKDLRPVIQVNKAPDKADPNGVKPNQPEAANGAENAVANNETNQTDESAVTKQSNDQNKTIGGADQGSTIKYIVDFSKKLGKKGDQKKGDVWPQIIAAIFAQQPGIYDKSLAVLKNDIDKPADQTDKPDVAERKAHSPELAPQISDNETTTSDFEKNEKTSQTDLEKTEQILKGYGENYSIVNDETRWQYSKIMDWFFKPDPITDELTLRLLYHVLGLTEFDILNMSHDSETETVEKRKRDNLNADNLVRQDYYFIRNWCANLISMLHDNPEVKKQKILLSVIHGPEQFGMLIVFFLSFFMMIGRLIMFCWNRYAFFSIRIIGKQSRFDILQKKNASPDLQKQLADRMNETRELVIDQFYPALINAYYAEDKDEQTRLKDVSDMLDYSFSLSNAMEQRSRWLINWSAAALPSIGFIGTVRGLLLALGNADSIVRATNALGQAAAITNVATQLSLAFTTTLVALLLGLIISLLNYWQVKAERNYLSLMDFILRNHFNIWGQFERNR